MVSVGPPLSARVPVAKTVLEFTFSRSPAMLPWTSEPKMLWPLLLVIGTLMSTPFAAMMLLATFTVGV